MAATGCVVLVGSKFNTALMVVIAGIIGAIFMK
jgi:hypothetical protein